MNVKRTVHNQTEEEHALTPEFCYEQAAQLLFAGNPGDYLQRRILTQEDLHAVSEWRQLGDSLLKMVL